MEEAKAVQSLAALAQAMRLRIFRVLVVAGGEGLTPSRLAEQLGVAPPTLSFHLKELLHAGLVSQERDGRNLIYRADFERMNDLLSFLTAHCCQGADCGVGQAVCKPKRTAKTAA
ncbi:MAG TPA: metalloregulator ArsR/SmtB family transcription factor [Ramlibacter sp.]|uniref:ArsR/SmtB family transcription factor n=1 Tax=Ramlibacter sp. TaxID=1917967 RepID=UPI002B75A38E|nr:metalloregulator ArsR/SmtB family transcription factor [Ramlibacter sp.]HVZ43405.1 metalloregulator ArsR/SmtB family transcription factor [Ramlibacter sp.]